MPHQTAHTATYSMLRQTARLAAELPRINQVGIQYLLHQLQSKVFGNSPLAYLQPKSPELLDLVKGHLTYHRLLGKKTKIHDPISIANMPGLVGKLLDEHFSRIGAESSKNYIGPAKEFLAGNLPKRPSQWLKTAGWTRYEPGKQPEPVKVPLENELVFDVEVLYKVSKRPVLCTAASSKAWYGWVSPVIAQLGSDWPLIPFETHKKPKLLVGYNVSYDRARVREEYSLKQPKAFFLDAMALHIALSGITTQQRLTWLKHKKHKMAIEDDNEEVNASGFSTLEVLQEISDDPWLIKGAPNSLANVAEFHCGIKLDKDPRSVFDGTDVGGVIDGFPALMDYCALDVEATFAVAKKLFPRFLERNPHPVLFAALRHLGTLFLPTTRKWDKYIESAERVYSENREKVSIVLQQRVNELVRHISEGTSPPEYEKDEWLSQLDWTIRQPRVKKDGSPTARQAYLVGYPEWYRELFKSVGDGDERKRELNITVRTRITPLLLRLKWEGYPLYWTDSQGWCFKVPYSEDTLNHLQNKGYHVAQLSKEDLELHLPNLRGNGAFELFKVPHPEGPKKRTTQVMGKNYLQHFASGVLTSQYDYASEILNLNAAALYWMGNRSRIMDQFVVYEKDTGIIIPNLCPMGTITRRATENTWLTASNSKANRIGSEMKAMVQAPPGYCFVGADVDSEELWIASLIGDLMFQIHGGTALGWMTLEGEKLEKTDLHSKTAEIMGILRDDAKVFNYGRIYGAGARFATRLLKQCNAKLTDSEAAVLAEKLYELTKGQLRLLRFLSRKLYHGGTELVMFNALELIAYQADPKTPVLGASITDALNQRNLNKNNYLTLRINWTIQSSGVDYLHLLIVAMEYLAKLYKVEARLMITVHDELRYMVKLEDRFLCALLLQVSNVWTRAMFCEQLGLDELPQSCAFFSEVDIDHVLRKDVRLECVTPSHREPIPPGKLYTISEILNEVSLPEMPTKLIPRGYKYKARKPVITMLDDDLTPDAKVAKLRLENSFDESAWKANMTKLIKAKEQPKKRRREVRISKGTANDELSAEIASQSTAKIKKTTAHQARGTLNFSSSGFSQRQRRAFLTSAGRAVRRTRQVSLDATLSETAGPFLVSIKISEPFKGKRLGASTFCTNEYLRFRSKSIRRRRRFGIF